MYTDHPIEIEGDRGRDRGRDQRLREGGRFRRRGRERKGVGW